MTNTSKRARTKCEPSSGADKSRNGEETPVDYMLRVMRDPDAEPGRRDTMAKSATPYVHAKPAPKKKRNGTDSSLKKKLETARETLAGKIAGLRPEGN